MRCHGDASTVRIRSSIPGSFLSRTIRSGDARRRIYVETEIVVNRVMAELDGPGLYRAVADRRPATSAFVAEVGAPSLMKPFDLQEVEDLVARLVAAAAPAAASQ